MISTLAIAASTLAILSDDEDPHDFSASLQRAWLTRDQETIEALLQRLGQDEILFLLYQLANWSKEASSLDDFASRLGLYLWTFDAVRNLVSTRRLKSFPLLDSTLLLASSCTLHPERTVVIANELFPVRTPPRFGGAPIAVLSAISDSADLNRQISWILCLEYGYQIVDTDTHRLVVSWDENRILTLRGGELLFINREQRLNGRFPWVQRLHMNFSSLPLTWARAEDDPFVKRAREWIERLPPRS